MPRKSFLLAKIALLCTLISSAQGREREMKTTAGASNLYLEVGGAGVIYSVNYDRRFGRVENGLGFRLGAGGAGGNGTGYLAIPAQLNYLLGNGGNYLELGAGATFFSLQDDFFFNDTGENAVLGTLNIGYRKQPFGKKGITFRAAFTPFIGGGGFYPFAGLSIGYRF